MPRPKDERQAQAHCELERQRLPPQVVRDLVASGYGYTEASLYGSGRPVPCVSDSFYGSKWGSGLIPIEALQKYLRTGHFPVFSVPSYEVASLTEAESVLSINRHVRFHNRMCFRGQIREYFTKRRFPNPNMRQDGGQERLIIPSIWRRFAHDWGSRFDFSPPAPLFSTSLGDDLVYYGIPEWHTLAVHNLHRYGIHTMSELEDLPDAESQEYGRRWRLHKVHGPFDPGLPLVEQHYGLSTCGLDVTFDLRVAFFFATHQFITAPDGTAWFAPAPDTARDFGVVYCFVFEDPPLIGTSDLVHKSHLFEHIPPLRPLRQRCALPSFHTWNTNEAVADLDAILHVRRPYDMSALPPVEELFPGADEDPFYRALLDIRGSGRQGPYREFIEYRRP